LAKQHFSEEQILTVAAYIQQKHFSPLQLMNFQLRQGNNMMFSRLQSTEITFFAP